MLTYEVNEIQIVLPNEVDSLYVRAGEDLCTLVTCTPYGINTHRLLVRGHRVETVKERAPVVVTADAVRVAAWKVALAVAAPLLLAFALAALVLSRRRD